MWQVWGWYENFALNTNYPQLFKCSHFFHRFYRDCLFWVFQVMLQITILFRTSYSLCHSLLMLFPGWDNQLELSYTIMHANVDLPEEFDMFNLIKNLVVLFLVWRNWKQNTNNNQNQEKKKVKTKEKPRLQYDYSPEVWRIGSWMFLKTHSHCFRVHVIFLKITMHFTVFFFVKKDNWKKKNPWIYARVTLKETASQVLSKTLYFWNIWLNRFFII